MNQYVPWKEMGIDELEYFKRRYLEMSAQLEQMTKERDRLKLLTEEAAPLLASSIAIMKERDELRTVVYKSDFGAPTNIQDLYLKVIKERDEWKSLSDAQERSLESYRKERDALRAQLAAAVEIVEEAAKLTHVTHEVRGVACAVHEPTALARKAMEALEQIRGGK